ncbi:MAG: (d)CMP kinase [Thermodesulfobacteriota bacterium]
MSEQQLVITIDGPSGVGKSTISRRVAAGLSYTYLDTGAMYRAVALKLQLSGVDPGDEAAVETVLTDLDIRLVPGGGLDSDVGVLLDDDDVSSLIRTPEMSMLASKVSAIPVVRKKLTQMQQQAGERGRVVAEGRDTGTIVFPRAICKFYLDAAPEERAERRSLQLKSQGKEVDEKELLAMIIKRDKDDRSRTIAPLTQAEDAHYIDSTDLSIDGVCEKLLAIARRSLSGPG